MSARTSSRFLALSLLMLAAAAVVPAAGAPSTAVSGSGAPASKPWPVARTWQGKWIWTPGEAAPRNSYTYFRKNLELDSKPKEANVVLTADSRYQLWVNGEFVGRGPVRSDRRWLYYDTWEVTPHLKKGRNVIALVVHHLGESSFQYMEGRGGLIADITGPGDRALAQTDGTWKALRSEAWIGGPKQPRMDLQLGFNEMYDARKAPEGWRDPEFDDKSWPDAQEIGGAGMEPWPHLIARDIPPMREEPLAAKRVLETVQVATPSGGGEVSRLMNAEARSPLKEAWVEAPEKAIQHEEGAARVKTAPGADCSLLIDFGKEVTGFPQFRIRGAKGGEIVDMGYGEVLQDAKGAFLPQTGDRIGHLNPDRDGVHYADRYICKPGKQRFRTFDKRGFRYLQIDVRNAPDGVDLDDVSILFSTYPVELRGAFQCSDDRLNRIWEIGRYTCQLNMEDGFTDCPWRERGQWWGDARVEALINYYCFGDTALIRKALRQKGQSLNEEGMTWGIYPTDFQGGRLPSFTLIWVSTLWDTYRYTGDREIVRELFPKVRYTLDHFFAPRVSPQGLLKDVPYWVFIDWAPVETEGQGGALNAYYYDALHRAAQMARLLGDSSAEDYEKRADAVKQALNRELWDPELHAYHDSIQKDGKRSPKVSQQTNSLCVLFDIAPAAEQQRLLDYLYAPENHGKVVEAGSPYFSYYQLAAMYHAGQRDRALAYTREHWGRMLDWGATTWWEMWQPGASFCHGWSGGPTYDLSSQILGIEPLKPGFAEVSVSPHWMGLSFASAVVPTVHGDVQVAWQRQEQTGTTMVRVETAKDIPAEITLPVSGSLRVNKKSDLPRGMVRLDAAPGWQRFRSERGGSFLFELKDKG